MSLISYTNITDGTSIDASDVNNPFNTIYNDYNGGITNANINTSAAIDASKLAGGTSGMFGAWTAYTPTFGGFSSPPTVIARYIVIGKTCIVSIYPTVNGTSNSTSFTVTAPVTSANIANMLWFGRNSHVDNGSASTTEGTQSIGSNTTTINVYQNSNLQGWTSSAAKAATFTLIYETA